MRKLCFAVDEVGELKKPVTITRLLEIASSHGIDIPGVEVHTTDVDGKRGAAKLFGIKIAPEFRRFQEIPIDGYKVIRITDSRPRDGGKGDAEVRVYVVSKGSPHDHEK